MHPQQLQTTKISRKRFLQLSFVTIIGLLMWSPFRETGRSLLPAGLAEKLGSSFSFNDVKDIKMMTQVEYDGISPDNQTLYVIS